MNCMSTGNFFFIETTWVQADIVLQILLVIDFGPGQFGDVYIGSW